MEQKKPAAHEIVDSIAETIEARPAQTSTDEETPEAFWAPVAGSRYERLAASESDKWSAMAAFRSGASKSAMRGF